MNARDKVVAVMHPERAMTSAEIAVAAGCTPKEAQDAISRLRDTVDVRSQYAINGSRRIARYVLTAKGVERAKKARQEQAPGIVAHAMKHAPKSVFQLGVL